MYPLGKRPLVPSVFGVRFVLIVISLENEVPIPILAPAVISGQRAKCSVSPLGKSTNVKVFHLWSSGSAHVKDRFIRQCCVQRPAVRIRPSSEYPRITGFPSSDSEVDGSWSSDGILPRESALPSAGRLDL
jgi:hypothetical protein